MVATDQKMINEIYDHLADELNITETMAERAIESYQAVGKWLGDCEPQLDVMIMPQGSFSLGTVTKPINDKDEYDIDLVCLLKNGQQLDEYQIKNVVGKRLKEHLRYEKMLTTEGKRCWTLQYEAFHMDILPCVPQNAIFMKPLLTEIRLTHKEAVNIYEPRYSNPEGYHAWFEEQMCIMLSEQKKFFATKRNVDISEVPTRLVRTPLQKAVQLLKRHRDIKYGTNDDAPISIIITTLAALSYDNESTVYETLERILNHMETYIENRNGVYWIANPVMPEENFADKWANVPQKRKAFFSWLSDAKNDILQKPISARGLDDVAVAISDGFGKSLSERTIKNIGFDTRDQRNAGHLFVSWLKGGITTEKATNTNKVGGHTFFGT